MEIKATLQAPYTEEQKVDFIMYYGQNSAGELSECYEIRGEQPETLTAWGHTEEEKAAKRKASFEADFLTLDTNKNFRLEPKGYANAQQSIDTVNTLVDKLGSLTEQIATMVLFYETPDFTDETQCTEEWLVAHQYSADPMTKAEWDAFYIDFTTKYAQKKYMQELAQQTDIDYTKYTVVQLKQIADERGISYSSNILKADLISLLENN